MQTQRDDLSNEVRKLTENTDFAGTLFENLVGYAIMAVDFDGTVIAYNEGARQIYGYEPSDVVVIANIESFFPPEFVESGGFQQLTAILLATGRFTCEGEKVRKNGQRFPAQILFTLTKDKRDKVVGFVEIVQDLTERKRFERELRDHRDRLARANEELRREVAERKRAEDEAHVAQRIAEAANRAKAQFVANVSHEIRTPMNAILGMAQLVLDTNLTPEQRDYLTVVKESADNLLVIINDVLDLSKMDAGKLELECRDFALRATVGDTLRALVREANSKGLKLFYQVAPDVPDSLWGDAGRIRQVVTNLAGNAIKFTARGEVAVRIAREPWVGEEVSLHFTVSDTGIGIPDDMQDVIFAPFVQVDGSTTRKYGGTGLGLSIARQLVEAMEGRIWVESRLGQGSTFHFTVKLGSPRGDGQFCMKPAGAHGEEAGQDQANGASALVPKSGLPEVVVDRRAPESPRSLRVLLAEDNPFNQRVASIMLQKRGHSVRLAANGKEALDAFAEESFDVILMDVQMPELDGLAATGAIRAQEAGTGRHIPILAMTAHAMKDDRDRCLAAGMDGYISKPIRKEELCEAVENCIKPQRGSEPAGLAEPAVMDLDVALARVDGDKAFLQRMITLFLADCPGLVAQMQVALDQGQAQPLTEAAHKLKNWVGNLAAPKALETVRKLEAMSRNNDLSGAVAAFETLRPEIERFSSVLKAYLIREASPADTQPITV